ncbi:Tryptophan synthase alpha chain (EC [Olavius algarvensis Delta 1 endosymbiont]|nr:Tryptophan synthase alpha chain (EC [Olavius algarvensis Delta 1 endosymbiont]
MLNAYLRNRLAQKEILLMTHIVLGYPSFEASSKIIETMVAAGVDLMELQIPFSEPTADGPVIARANQKALEDGVSVEKCLEFAGTAARRFDIPFLIMSYYNVPYQYGLSRFAAKLADAGLQGAIVPDIPPEEGQEYLEVMQQRDLAPILIYAPTTSLARMQYIASFAAGFIYCVARKGVTGQKTSFSNELDAYLNRCRRGTDLPLALGFGLKEKADIDFLKGKADIAVIGTQTIRVMEKHGTEGVGEFIRGLR